jgi:hypothetical protein
MSTQRALQRRSAASIAWWAPALLALACTSSPIDRLGGADSVIERFRQIHSQVYRVYSLGPDRDAIHAQLAAAFAGDALTREYVEHWTTLARMREEGTAIDVLSVDYESVAVAGTSPQGVLVEADWSVGGIVTHQRHKHHRINRYQAVYTVAMAANGDGETPALHIVDTRVRNAERVATPLESPGSNGFPLDELPKSERGFLGPAELLRSGILDQAPESGPTPPIASPPGERASEGEQP